MIRCEHLIRAEVLMYMLGCRPTFEGARDYGGIARSNVRETHSGSGSNALAPSTGVRGRWGFHRYPLCEPIRFLGRDRCLLHSYGNEAAKDGYRHSEGM